MRVPKYVMPVVVIVALLGAVYTAKAVGAWQTSGREMIDPTKPLTSADIKGWMPLSYLSERLGLSHGELCTMLGLPAQTPPGTPLKELESVIEVGEVREIIAEHLDEAPVEHDDSTGAHKEEAVPTPTPTPMPSATPTRADPGGEHVPGSGAGTGPGPTPLPPGEILPAAQIKGRMTLQEVSEQCGVPLNVLYEELSLPEDVSANTLLRDLKGLIDSFEVQLVRDVVAVYQGQ